MAEVFNAVACKQPLYCMLSVAAMHLLSSGWCLACSFDWCSGMASVPGLRGAAAAEVAAQACSVYKRRLLRILGIVMEWAVPARHKPRG